MKTVINQYLLKSNKKNTLGRIIFKNFSFYNNNHNQNIKLLLTTIKNNLNSLCFINRSNKLGFCSMESKTDVKPDLNLVKILRRDTSNAFKLI